MSAAIGHNRPHVDLYAALEPETLGAWLEDRFQPRALRTAELLAAYKRFLAATAQGINEAVAAGKATDFEKMLRAEIKEIELTRTAIKAPVLAATRQIDGHARQYTDPLLSAAGNVNERLTAYLQALDAEKRRLAAEEAAAAAERALHLADEALATGSQEAEQAMEEAIAESEQAQAVAEATPAAELTRMRTALGSTTALRDNWVYDGVEDLTQVPAAYLMVNEKVVAAAIKSGTRAIPGLKIVNRPIARVR